MKRSRQSGLLTQVAVVLLLATSAHAMRRKYEGKSFLSADPSPSDTAAPPTPPWHPYPSWHPLPLPGTPYPSLAPTTSLWHPLAPPWHSQRLPDIPYPFLEPLPHYRVSLGTPYLPHSPAHFRILAVPRVLALTPRSPSSPSQLASTGGTSRRTSWRPPSTCETTGTWRRT